MIKVQFEDFDIQEETSALRGSDHSTGAICTFIGLVRDFGDKKDLLGLTLEHYPGMTEKALESIVAEAKSRWSLNKVSLVHRVGPLALGDQIVFVGVSSSHRVDAFDACQFIMDYLKIKAPFWKKEKTKSGEEWVMQKESDKKRKDRWS